jgi:hypothetical protein
VQIDAVVDTIKQFELTLAPIPGSQRTAIGILVQLIGTRYEIGRI